MRNRRVLMDSDDEDEEEGEWIGEGSEQQINLGKAGGTDDEDAEGGGDTLGSIDSATDEEDSQTESEGEQEDESDDDTLPIISGLAPSHKPSHKPSTKIRHLLRILHRETPEHKTIVFSQFTSMLDLIEPHLKHGSIGYVRYDGSMRPDAREASLNSLRNNPKTRVLLCSLKCGSLGLNLTAASRVVIVEPFWNPFVEEQAIDRVHRLNQPVDVKVFRLTVRNTVEEKILALQEKKRQLAAAALEGGKGVGKLSMQDIMQLFRRDAEVAGDDEHDVAFAQKFGGDSKILDSSGGRAESRPGSSTPPERAGRVVAKKGVAKKPEHSVFGRRW
jgi:SNF2 family DNA or RNA helicase